MHPHVRRRPARTGRIIELVVVPVAEVSPQRIAEVIPFRAKPWRDRDMMPEVLQAFRDAKYGDT